MLILSDIDRVMAALSYPVSRYWKGLVVDAAAQLEKYGGAVAEARVIGYLNAIDAFDTQISAVAAKDNLIQADVLKWAGSRSGGLKKERDRLIALLAATLNLSPYSAQGSTGSGNILSRS